MQVIPFFYVRARCQQVTCIISEYRSPKLLGFVWIQGCHCCRRRKSQQHPFGSMHGCGWVWKEGESWVNSPSAQRWRESCTVEWECQVIRRKLQSCPYFCWNQEEQWPCMHATWSHEIPDLAQESFDSVWIYVKLWNESECSGWGRWAWSWLY